MELNNVEEIERIVTVYGQQVEASQAQGGVFLIQYKSGKVRKVAR